MARVWGEEVYLFVVVMKTSQHRVNLAVLKAWFSTILHLIFLNKSNGISSLKIKLQLLITESMEFCLIIIIRHMIIIDGQLILCYFIYVQFNDPGPNKVGRT